VTLAAPKCDGPISVAAPCLEATTTRPGRDRNADSTPVGVESQHRAAWEEYSRAIERMRTARPGTPQFSEILSECRVAEFAWRRFDRLLSGDLAEAEKILVLERARDLLRPKVREVTLRTALRAIDAAIAPALPRGTLRKLIEVRG
jgi:hypothetical protein